jgi:hypothetical protein
MFRNAYELLNAITRDRKGGNLPLVIGEWSFLQERTFEELSQANVDIDAAKQALKADGYFIWRATIDEIFLR